MGRVEERRQRKKESIDKIEEILNYIIDNREDVITTNENISFCGKIGPNVKFYGIRTPWFNQRNKNIKDNFKNLDVGFTQVNMKYLDESKQFQPLCCITVYRRMFKKQIELVTFHNMRMDKELNPYSPYFNGYNENAKVPTKDLDIYCNTDKSNQGKAGEVYSIIPSGYWEVDMIYDIINASKEKLTNIQKLKKINIHSTVDLITTQDDGQEM